MEHGFLFYRRPYTIWTTPIPRSNSSLDSPPVFLNGCHWFFSFEVRGENGNDPVWLFNFRRVHTEETVDSRFLLAILAKDKKGGFENIGCGTVGDGCESDCLCGGNVSLLEADYPNVDFSGVTMTFLLAFDYEIRNTTDYYQHVEKGHKSVQTSSYLPVQTCLANLSQNFRKLLDEGSDSDVRVMCGNRTFSTHGLILSARSEVFRAMLQNDMLERREGSVKISDIEPDVFELFLRYLYTGTLPELTADTASPLYEAADKYRVEGLKWRCGEFLAENLTPGSAFEILVMADAHSDKDLKERVVSYMLDEEIPDKEDDWSRFSDDHPKLSNEVLYRAYKHRKVRSRCK